MLIRVFVAFLLLAAGCAAGGGLRAPEVQYEPTPMDVVQAMLELAEVRRDELVADLGCGDGRIVIEAVKVAGVRGVCVDIDPRRIAEARRNAAAAGVEQRVRFLEQDLRQTDLREATVVMLFLSHGLNLELRPKLERELARGARIVSHWHGMGDWTPQHTRHVTSDGRERPVFLWTVDMSN
jgi:precorrin-6B methylase 2